MPPYSSGAVTLLVNVSMRRAGPSGPGSTTPLGLQRSEFEDFVNAYRPTLDVPRPDVPLPPPPRPVEETKVDFGKSIKKLMKRPQGSPNVQSKNKKSVIQRTPANPNMPAIVTSNEMERGSTLENKTVQDKKQKRPLSASIEATSLPPQIQATLLPPTTSDTKHTQHDAPSPLQQSPASSRNPKKTSKNGLDDPVKNIPENAPVYTIVQPAVPKTAPSVQPPVPNPNQVRKKVSIQEDKRRSGIEVCPTDAHCLIISGNNIARFLPPHHNPDPILSMRIIPIPERKYNLILEFQESSEPPRRLTSNSGLMVISPPDDSTFSSREQLNFFSWIKESHVSSMGMLLRNVERITEFPFLTYLVVNGGRQELSQKLQCVGSIPIPESRLRQLHFLAGYEETITISRPTPTTFPEKPTSDKTGFVVSLYQVLPGDDGVRFEQNWVMWTGARQIYRTVPDYMGLKRISVHKSIVPAEIINYCLICEFSNIMDYLTDACVIIDHLRTRCCGFTGIYRVLDVI